MPPTTGVYTPNRKKNNQTTALPGQDGGAPRKWTEDDLKHMGNPGLVPPPFTLKQLKDSIPAHCFERSLLRSFSYVFFDLVGVSALFFCATLIDHPTIPATLRYLLWPVYWILQGIVMTGVWVIAHECGHRAFSESTFINDFVGLILHTCLLVPYHSWRISHSRHHKNTAHMDYDEVFVPSVRSETTPTSKIAKTPVGLFVRIALMLLLGWPMYLLFNLSGRKYDRPANHFNPNSPIFNERQKGAVVLSDIALIAWITILGFFSYHYGFLQVVKYYGIPYLFVNMWLVVITELQHTDKELPHYRDGEWNWLRGALSTVDRDYGILNTFFHHIGDTHICHHIFSNIPHYHAEEATKHMKKVLGKYYRFDNTPIFASLFKSFRECEFVEDNVKIAWYKNFSGL